MKINNSDLTYLKNTANFQPLDENRFEKVSRSPDTVNIGEDSDYIRQDEAADLHDIKRNPPHDKSTKQLKDQPAIQPRQWTVLTYLNGNCDLQDDMEKDLRTLEKVGSDDKIAFVAQIARSDKNGEAERIFLKKPGFLGFKKNSEVVENLGPTNMAHPQTLKDFISWGMRKYPAEHYMVIVSGHGYGFLGSLPDEKSGDLMLTSELQSALETTKKETGRKIDILGMDSCLMGNAETAYAVKNAVDFMVASEEVISSENWDYKQFASSMKEKVNGAGLSVGIALEEMVKAQANSHLTTSSVINCLSMPEFAENLKDFSEKLLETDASESSVKRAFRQAQGYCQPGIMAMAGQGNTNTDPMNQMRDLQSLTMEIITSDEIGDIELKKSALKLARQISEKTIIFNMNQKGMGIDRSNGISIYAPTRNGHKYSDYYSTLSLAKDTRWDEVVKKYGG
jgi:hypothetical protein